MKQYLTRENVRTGIAILLTVLAALGLITGDCMVVVATAGGAVATA